MAITGVSGNSYHGAHQASNNKKTANNADGDWKTEFMEKMLEKAKEEPTYQIGGSSYTLKEWDKLIERVDKDIEGIKEEQAERAEKLKAEEIIKNPLVHPCPLML